MLTTADPEIVFLATSRSPATSQHISKRLDGYHTIQFMERGGVALSYDGNPRVMEGAWFWPAYPGPWIDFHPAPGYSDWAHRHVGFQGPLVGAWQARGLWPFAPQPAQDAQASARFFDDLIAFANRTDTLGRLRAVNLIEQLLLEMADRRAEPGAGRRLARSRPRTVAGRGRFRARLFADRPRGGHGIEYPAPQVSRKDGSSDPQIRDAVADRDGQEPAFGDGSFRFRKSPRV